ncbi:hypothetical protein BDF14DRAFT_1746069 [Spinellus fusiger]|nr:hypothetical protein BDF14DRAFT_1746069 [Spinellus fusiger]
MVDDTEHKAHPNVPDMAPHGPSHSMWSDTSCIEDESDSVVSLTATLASTGLEDIVENESQETIEGSCISSAIPLAQILKHFPYLHDFLFHPYFPTFARLWLDFQYQLLLAKDAAYRPAIQKWLALVSLHLHKIPNSSFHIPSVESSRQEEAEKQRHAMETAFYTMKTRVELTRLLLESIENGHRWYGQDPETSVDPLLNSAACQTSCLNTSIHLSRENNSQAYTEEMASCIAGLTHEHTTIHSSPADEKISMDTHCSSSNVPELEHHRLYWPEDPQAPCFSLQNDGSAFYTPCSVASAPLVALDSSSWHEHRKDIAELDISHPNTPSSSSSSSSHSYPHNEPSDHVCLDALLCDCSGQFTRHTMYSSYCLSHVSPEPTVAPMKTYIHPVEVLPLSTSSTSTTWSLPVTPSAHPTHPIVFWSCPASPDHS